MPLSTIFQIYRGGHSYIGEGIRSTRRKLPTFRKSLVKKQTYKKCTTVQYIQYMYK